MNLYLFNANDGAAMYGLGTYLKEVTYALKDTAINIHIVHLHSTRQEFEIEVRQNARTNQVEHWYIPEVHDEDTFSGSVQKLEDYYHNVTYLLRLYIKDVKDLIFHFNFNQCHCLAKELKMVFNCKTVATIHYFRWAFELHGNLSRLHALKMKSENQRNLSEQMLYKNDEYESFLYKEADHIIALSPYTQTLLRDDYQVNPDKIVVIPNGLEDISPQMDTGKTILRRKWRIPEDEYIILFAGRLHAVKGIVYLIRAFRKVLEKIPNCRLMIAGHGNFDNYMKECEDIWMQVTWTGRVDKNKLFELYSISDIGVMPSLYEPFGYVAVEMMMHGLPIVATATSGLNEVVDDTCGLKVPIREYPDVEIDIDSLAEKILYLLQHSEEAKRLGVNGRQRYLEKYSLPVYRKNMLDFYNSIFPK